MKVTASNGGGSASAVSSSVGPVTEPAVVEPPPGDDEQPGDSPPIQPVPKPELTIIGKPSAHKKGKQLVVSTGQRAVCPEGSQLCRLWIVGKTKIRKSVTVGQHAVTVKPGRTADGTFVLRSKGMSALRKKGRMTIKLVATLRSPGSDTLTSTRTFILKKPAWLK